MAADFGDFPTAEAIEVTSRVARLLERLGVSYCVGGSLASSLYGIPRSTQDADLAVALRTEHVEPLIEGLEEDFYVSRERVLDAVGRQASFNVIHLQTLFKIDIFCVGDEAHARAQLERCQRLTVGARSFEVASPEDTVLHKLVWYRRGGEVSDRQWEDLRGVLEVQARRLDREYLLRWALELGVSDLLGRALEELDEGELKG